MKVVIVDDEAHILKTLNHYLKQHAMLEVVGTASNVSEALEVILKNKPDTLFLDVELENQLSFEILKKLPHNNYKIVFITAHAHYAIQAIRFSAFDYLLKPVHPDKLSELVERLLEDQEKTNLENRILALEENLKKQNQPQRLVLKTAEKYIVINQDDIINLKADNTYTKIYAINKKPIMISQSIKHFEDLLPQNKFIRTHRSHIINISHVSEYIKSDGGYILMDNDNMIPLSNTNKSNFIAMLDL